MNIDGVTSIFSRLNECEVKYLIVGGLAVVAHGYVHLTVDIDIVLDMQFDNMEKALQTLHEI